ncbi:hypothetical protein Dimus_021106 [Dionaea muscipula]
MAIESEYCSCGHDGDEYIDLEIPTFSRDFELQMWSSSSSIEAELFSSTNSPADELFYKGKLLPLHLPPRLQMVEDLLQGLTSDQESKCKFDGLGGFYGNGTPLTTNSIATPFESSCNVSPSGSCYLNTNEENGLTTNYGEPFGKKSSWTRQLKLLIKDQSSFGSKLKSSGAYLKSLFISKLSSSQQDQSSTTAEASSNKDTVVKGGRFLHRRSFSGTFRRRSTVKLSSLPDSSSFSNEYLHRLRRSSSANSDVERSIQAAIVHCKGSNHPKHRAT